MPHFSLELYERDGSSRRRAMTAADYEEMLDKLAAKSGLDVGEESFDWLEVPLDER